MDRVGEKSKLINTTSSVCVAYRFDSLPLMLAVVKLSLVLVGEYINQGCALGADDHLGLCFAVSASALQFVSSMALWGKKLLVIGTTSKVSFLDSVGVCDAFSVTYHLPTLKTEDAKKVLEQLNVFSKDDVDAAAEALNDCR
ncbi:hypothetical protein NL676_012322 [Syzygium grande]|nr:hypothetical protein NL676_012322 [Syzygium grande]